ncbi:MAG: alpha/beta hydrolase [Verrucomicrobiota bacterium]|jgi:pimeloyl-ACP methyl ester carboxylesterase
MSQTGKFHIRRKRAWKIFLSVCGMIFLFAFATLHAIPGLFAKFDDPARLGAPIQVAVTNGFKIRFVEKLEATHSVTLALVFIHGTPGGAGVWAAQFQTPFTNANLLAYNRPGFGGSKPVRARPHLQLQVDALMTLLAGITTNRVLLVGHSYGSPIAMLAGLEHPEKIAGVLMIGGDVDPALEKPWLLQYIFGWRATSWILPQALRQCNRELLTVRADLTDMQKMLPKLSVPVVMLHGDRDPLVPVENVAWLEQQLAAVGKTNLFKKVILPGVNHFIPWEHPEAVERAIRKLDEMQSRENAHASANP